MSVKAFIRLLLFLCSVSCLASDQPNSIPPAYGSAPECPKHEGTRTNRSEVAQYQQTTIYIEGTAVRKSNKCEREVAIRWRKAKGKTKHLPLDSQNSEYQVVDFSPDGSSVLVQWSKFTEGWREQEQIRLGLLSLTSGAVQWRDAFKILRWKDCVATVDAEGFLPDGRIVIRPRPWVRGRHLGSNCVAKPTLYSIRLDTEQAEKLSDDTAMVRRGKRIANSHQSCKTDPDIVSECFWTHGRASYYNGGPSLRIWRIGTDRMLGVTTEELPPNAAALMDSGDDVFDNDVYGEFQVCPFEKQKPGHMQPVCVESAKKLVAKKR